MTSAQCLASCLFACKSIQQGSTLLIWYESYPCRAVVSLRPPLLPQHLLQYGVTSSLSRPPASFPAHPHCQRLHHLHSTLPACWPASDVVLDLLHHSSPLTSSSVESAIVPPSFPPSFPVHHSTRDSGVSSAVFACQSPLFSLLFQRFIARHVHPSGDGGWGLGVEGRGEGGGREMGG